MGPMDSEIYCKESDSNLSIYFATSATVYQSEALTTEDSCDMLVKAIAKIKFTGQSYSFLIRDFQGASDLAPDQSLAKKRHQLSVSGVNPRQLYRDAGRENKSSRVHHTVSKSLT